MATRYTRLRQARIVEEVLVLATAIIGLWILVSNVEVYTQFPVLGVAIVGGLALVGTAIHFGLDEEVFELVGVYIWGLSVPVYSLNYFHHDGYWLVLGSLLALGSAVVILLATYRLSNFRATVLAFALGFLLTGGVLWL